MKPTLSLLLFLCFFSATAQSSLPDMLRQQMIKDWVRAKSYTQQYLDAMPAAQYGFHAVDSIRSFSQQMLHLAFSNVALVTVGSGAGDSAVKKMFLTRNLEQATAAQNKDSVVYYVNTSYDYVINVIKNLDFGKLNEVVNQRTQGGNRSETRLAWLMKAFEHQTHHRGQCTIYIRLLGIRPPAEWLF